MIITYLIGNSLYVNVTNRCTNRCTFCIRNTLGGIGEGIDLWLNREPSVNEIIASIKNRDLKEYQEIVFCGYGEPIIRFYDIMEVCRSIKKDSDIPIRINTNGHANEIHGKDITPLMKGLVDTISISLNARNAEEYEKICLCDYGEQGFYIMLDFAEKSKHHVNEVILSVVDILPPDDIKECSEIAERLGVTFRVRKYNE